MLGGKEIEAAIIREATGGIGDSLTFSPPVVSCAPQKPFAALPSVEYPLRSGPPHANQE